MRLGNEHNVYGLLLRFLEGLLGRGRSILALFVQCAGSYYCWHKHIWQIYGLFRRPQKDVYKFICFWYWNYV